MPALTYDAEAREGLVGNVDLESHLSDSSDPHPYFWLQQYPITQEYNRRPQRAAELLWRVHDQGRFLSSNYTTKSLNLLPADALRPVLDLAAQARSCPQLSRTSSRARRTRYSATSRHCVSTYANDCLRMEAANLKDCRASTRPSDHDL